MQGNQGLPGFVGGHTAVGVIVHHQHRGQAARPHAGHGLQSKIAVGGSLVHPYTQGLFQTAQDGGGVVDVAGRAPTDADLMFARWVEAEEVIKGDDAVDTCQRKAEFPGKVLEVVLAQVTVVTLDLLSTVIRASGSP